MDAPGVSMENANLGFCLDDNVLSAAQLLNYCKSVDQSLPKASGNKHYAPAGEWFEQKQINCMLQKRFELVSEPRYAKLGDLVHGEWNPELHMVTVSKPKSKLFRHMGIRIKNVAQLYPEEALFAMEMCSLEVHYRDVPLSLKEAYAILLPKPFNLRRYQVYAHLSRMGYTVVMHQVRSSMTLSGNKLKTEDSKCLSSIESCSTKIQKDNNGKCSLVKDLNFKKKSCTLGVDEDSEINEGNINHPVPDQFKENDQSVSQVHSMELHSEILIEESEPEIIECSSDVEIVMLPEQAAFSDGMIKEQLQTEDFLPNLPFMFRNTSFLSSFLPTKFTPIMHQKILGMGNTKENSQQNLSLAAEITETPVENSEVICLTETFSNNISQTKDQSLSDIYSESWTLKAELKMMGSEPSLFSDCNLETTCSKVCLLNRNDKINFPNFFGKSVVSLIKLPENLLPKNVKLSRDVYSIKSETFLNAANTKPACYRNQNNFNRRYGNSNRNWKSVQNWSRPENLISGQNSFTSRAPCRQNFRHDFLHRKPSRWDTPITSVLISSDTTFENLKGHQNEQYAGQFASPSQMQGFTPVNYQCSKSFIQHESSNSLLRGRHINVSAHKKNGKVSSDHPTNQAENIIMDNHTMNNQSGYIDKEEKRNDSKTYYSGTETISRDPSKEELTSPCAAHAAPLLRTDFPPCIDLNIGSPSHKNADKILLPVDCNFVSLNLSSKPSEATKSMACPTETGRKGTIVLDETPKGCPRREGCARSEDFSLDNSSMDIDFKHGQYTNAVSTQINLVSNARKPSIFNNVGMAYNTSSDSPSHNSNFATNSSQRSNFFQTRHRWKQDGVFTSRHPRKRLRRDDTHAVDDYPSCITKLGIPVYSWSHYKFVMGALKTLQDSGLGEEKFLYTATIKPLVHNGTPINTENMMSKLKVVPQVNLTFDRNKSSLQVSERTLTFDFDVYLPSVHHRLSCPALPNLRLVVVSSDDPVPMFSQLVYFQLPIQDGVPAYFAVVGDDDAPVFYGIHDISLPDFVSTEM